MDEREAPRSAAAPLRVFCSFAQPDEALLDELRKHLAPLRRAGLVEVWHDRMITPGSEVKQQVDLRLDEADLILLLISPDFTASDYCYGVEAARALGRHDRGEAVVIPIMLRPVDIELLPISRLGLLPSDLRPITMWPDRDAAWLSVEQGIRKAIEALGERRAARVSEVSEAREASVVSEPLRSVAFRPAARPFCVPPFANRFYPIREAVLDELHRRFNEDPDAPMPRLACICGFGGTGKTHTALHYAHRYRDEYSAVFLVRAGTELSIRQGFFDIAVAVSGSTRRGDPLDLEAAVREARAYLAGTPGWLLIFDHVEDPEIVAPFIPEGGRGHVLITSQKGDVQVLGVVSPIHLDGLSIEDAMAFFRARTGRALDEPAEQEAAEKLADELGRIPIALEQAAAYITAMNVPFAVHLRALRSHPGEVLGKYRAVFGNRQATAAGIWDMSLAKVEAESKASLALLHLSALLHGERIPLSLFYRDDHLLPEVVAELGPELSAALRDVESLYEILQPLSAYSLVLRAPGADWYCVNSMLQKVLRIRMGPEAEAIWIERTVRMIERVIRPLGDRDLAHERRIVPQVKHAIDLILERGIASIEAARILNRGGAYAHEQARDDLAETMFQRALAILRGQARAPEIDVAASLDGLGRIRAREGLHREAEALFAEAAELRKKAAGPDRPEAHAAAPSRGSPLP
ncbi:MAG: toll/interleukin-1 receptor domain-containing protein [Byssovorax sp.]